MDIFAGSGFMGAAAIKGSHINHLALDFVKMDIPADIKKPPSYRMQIVGHWELKRISKDKLGVVWEQSKKDRIAWQFALKVRKQFPVPLWEKPIDIGMGVHYHKQGTSYFRIIHWPYGNRIRQHFGLPSMDFSILLASNIKDICNKGSRSPGHNVVFDQKNPPPNFDDHLEYMLQNFQHCIHDPLFIRNARELLERERSKLDEIENAKLKSRRTKALDQLRNLLQNVPETAVEASIPDESSEASELKRQTSDTEEDDKDDHALEPVEAPKELRQPRKRRRYNHRKAHKALKRYEAYKEKEAQKARTQAGKKKPAQGTPVASQ